MRRLARELGVSDAQIVEALAGFGGVKRRFTKTGETHGVTIIDDYGHHPVEIAAVLKAARQAGARDVIAGDMTGGTITAFVLAGNTLAARKG